MVFVLGLTGSIGMGKSATADLFRSFGVPVYDADATVHDLYRNEAVVPISKHFPNTVKDNIIDREALSAEVLDSPEKMRLLESLVHPLVWEKERVFVKAAASASHRLVVLDSPLLLETGGEARCDAVAVVSAPAHIQRQRVLSRAGMTEEKLKSILAKQIPDREKRLKAHFIIDSSRGLDDARLEVEAIIRCLSGRTGKGNPA
ncbi:dephospho-CoA kinase [Microvirga sp. W0021]|uniref:Dephospho-CoA kinase n=1 Tax=Hohaiivirga grylli TaxID=3133970 RepID=A0ABV0BG00_9HYPH